ncbi:MAG: hypothetical protein ACI8S7_001741, partial [Candidatus Krumholzibacteriia bacterium]
MYPGLNSNRISIPFLGGLLVLMCVFSPAPALESFDFETPYLVHPDQQVWDFCLIRDAGLYHVFYHTIPQQAAHPANADTIWHATSSDLRNWNILGPSLTAGPGWYDDVAMWAPDVVYDDASERWAMLYTGVAESMVQRACLAWSDDLITWDKAVQNPVFEPDSLTYHWAPEQAWSSFRDPFIYHDGAQWNMLSTAGLRLGGFPGYRRGIVHRAVSNDLVSWQDAGVFFEHDGSSGKSRDFESVQYLVRDGWHHLFFTEQDLNLDSHPTSHMVAADPSGWSMLTRTYISSGWAPEIKRFDAGASAEVYARLAKDQDPRDGTWLVTAKFDSVRFDNAGQTPVVILPDSIKANTFGENALLRQEMAQGIEGHGWFSTFEDYGGPLSGAGAPGAAVGDTATGRWESPPFTINGDHLRMLAGGGYYASTCYIALLDANTEAELGRINVNNTSGLGERFWDISAWAGQTVKLIVVDEETGPNGWIAVDGIEERVGGLSAVGDDLPGDQIAQQVSAWPNPFNPRTTIQFEMGRAGNYRLEIYDLAGRR